MFVSLNFLLFVSHPLLAKTLTVGVHHGLDFPDYKKVENEHTGLIPRIIEPFAKAKGLSVSYKNVPRKRMNQFLKTGEVQVRCLYSKKWVGDPEDFLWSKVFLVGKNIFIRLKESAELSQISELKGKSFAGITGYRYSEDLRDLVDGGSLYRSNVLTMGRVMEMLVLKRADYGLGAKRILQHLMKERPQITFTKLIESEYKLRCAFSKNLSEKIVKDFDRFYSKEKIKNLLADFNLP